MTPADFVTQLQSLRFDATFNPYVDHCTQFDHGNASQQRAEILAQMLNRAAAVGVEALWVGRDLGHRGGRRTGLALTDDVHFDGHLARWDMRIARPTLGHPVSEKTASVIWELLARIDQPIFLWNVFPLHPHLPEDPFTNRSHNARERRAGTEILRNLIKLVRPKRLIAVGNDAEAALLSIAEPAQVTKVRHPSFGGQAQFSEQIRTLYALPRQTLL